MAEVDSLDKEKAKESACFPTLNFFLLTEFLQNVPNPDFSHIVLVKTSIIPGLMRAWE
ncbi:MAG: hypothetical protein OXU61_12030 [Gammaproteobacteria bacterium]|nr:hypothetical protein [Gammaproteobacteria bacterium]